MSASPEPHPGCPHCGATHTAGELVCPQTGWPMAEPGLMGQTVDRYRVDRWLGGGGFGAVYAAEHTVMRRPVALKVLHPQRVKSEEAVRRFFEEAKAAAAIGSPHIVHIYDAGTTARGMHFLAMERIEGCSLQEALAAQPVMPLRRAGFITLQILKALAAAHAAGIVHRDIKPGNIMLEGTSADRTRMDDVVRLVDFGISKVPRDDLTVKTRTGVTLGTPGYAPPEQYLSAADVDARADVYSASAVLFSMLTGELPHARCDSYEELVVKVCTEPARKLGALRDDLPAALCALVDQGLAIRPEDRVPSAKAYVAGLSVVLEGYLDDVEEDPETGTVRPGAWNLGAASTVNLAELAEGVPGAPIPSYRAPSTQPDEPRPIPLRRGVLVMVGAMLLASGVGAAVVLGGPGSAEEPAGPALESTAEEPSPEPTPASTSGPRSVPTTVPTTVSAPPRRPPETTPLPPEVPEPTSAPDPAPAPSVASRRRRAVAAPSTPAPQEPPPPTEADPGPGLARQPRVLVPFDP